MISGSQKQSSTLWGNAMKFIFIITYDFLFIFKAKQAKSNKSKLSIVIMNKYRFNWLINWRYAFSLSYLLFKSTSWVTSLVFLKKYLLVLIILSIAMFFSSSCILCLPILIDPSSLFSKILNLNDYLMNPLRFYFFI